MTKNKQDFFFKKNILVSNIIKSTFFGCHLKVVRELARITGFKIWSPLPRMPEKAFYFPWETWFDVFITHAIPFCTMSRNIRRSVVLENSGKNSRASMVTVGFLLIIVAFILVAHINWNLYLASNRECIFLSHCCMVAQLSNKGLKKCLIVKKSSRTSIMVAEWFKKWVFTCVLWIFLQWQF